jgi:hypothetical protein
VPSLSVRDTTRRVRYHRSGATVRIAPGPNGRFGSTAVHPVSWGNRQQWVDKRRSGAVPATSRMAGCAPRSSALRNECRCLAPLIPGRRRNLARREWLWHQIRAAQLPPPSHPPNPLFISRFRRWFASPIGHHIIAMIASYRTDSGPGEPVRDFASGVAHA